MMYYVCFFILCLYSWGSLNLATINIPLEVIWECVLYHIFYCLFLETPPLSRCPPSQVWQKALKISLNYCWQLPRKGRHKLDRAIDWYCLESRSTDRKLDEFSSLGMTASGQDGSGSCLEWFLCFQAVTQTYHDYFWNTLPLLLAIQSTFVLI